MSLEESFSEIERRLRNLESLTNTQDSSQINYGVISTPTDWFLEGEWIWIKLTAKQATSGQYFYGWKQMLRLVDPTGGYIWVESGKEGSVNEFPAIALNNDNVSVTDGKRYPARWNPDTYQWIFFFEAGIKCQLSGRIMLRHSGQCLVERRSVDQSGHSRRKHRCELFQFHMDRRSSGERRVARCA